jgi:hypothetical protein
MEDVDLIRAKLKAGELVVVSMKGQRTLEDFSRHIFRIIHPTDLTSSTVVLKSCREDKLTDMYDHTGQKLLQGVYIRRFTLPKVLNKDLKEYL